MGLPSGAAIVGEPTRVGQPLTGEGWSALTDLAAQDVPVHALHR
jgi:hypothetical protein